MRFIVALFVLWWLRCFITGLDVIIRHSWHRCLLFIGWYVPAGGVYGLGFRRVWLVLPWPLHYWVYSLLRWRVSRVRAAWFRWRAR